MGLSRAFTALAVAAVVTWLQMPLLAQRPLHPLGVPTGPDGRLNPAALAPRTPEGRPDLSGIWYYGTLEIEVTIDDPKAYTRPFTVRIEQRVATDGQELIEFICHENQMFLKLTGREPRR